MLQAFLTNWKTTLAGIVWFGLYGLQTVGVAIPGVHVDPSSLPLALALIFARDQKSANPPPAATK